MRVVADSHAIFWDLRGSDRLSSAAAEALQEAERIDGIVVSVATLVDLWYVTQTTQGLTVDDLAMLRAALDSSAKFVLEPIDARVADASTAIPRASLGDPWDRFIVATAKALDLPLATRDEPIQKAAIVPTIW